MMTYITITTRSQHFPAGQYTIERFLRKTSRSIPWQSQLLLPDEQVLDRACHNYVYELL